MHGLELNRYVDGRDAGIARSLAVWRADITRRCDVKVQLVAAGGKLRVDWYGRFVQLFYLLLLLYLLLVLKRMDGAVERLQKVTIAALLCARRPPQSSF